MTIGTTTVWTSSLAPGQLFRSREEEEAEEHEQKIMPRLVVKQVLMHEGRVDADDEAVIDKIVANLGELWNVRGFVSLRIG